MSLTSSVNWSALLQPNPTIPSDITFSVVEHLTDTAMTPCSPTSASSQEQQSQVTTFKAHKYYLAAASPVFATQFFGSLPEENTEIVLKDVTAMAFKTMLEFIYGQNVTLFEESNIRELFEALYVADKYLVEKMKEFIAVKLENFVISRDNVVEVVRATLSFKCFQADSCKLLQRLKEFNMPIRAIKEVFDIAELFESENLMKTVLVNCTQILHNIWYTIDDVYLEFFWFCFLTGNKICCNQTMPETVQAAAKGVVDACVYKFQHKESQARILMSVTCSSPERERSLFEILKLVQNGFCKNCNSSPCQDGKLLAKKGIVEDGCKVRKGKDSDYPIAGIVTGGMFKNFNDLDGDDLDEDFYDSTIPQRKFYKVKIADDNVIFVNEWLLIYNCK